MTARRAARVGAALVVLAAGALLALAGATHLALRSDWLLGQIDADPDTLFIAYTRPRASLVPGRIRFATLVVRSQDSNVQWEARLEDVTVNVVLRSLAARRFRASTVRAAGLSFHLREKLTREEATPARAGRYPNIVGFRDPPLRDPPAPPAAPGHPWRVAVDDLRVLNLREIWIDAWRWEGEGLLAGGFRLRPGIEAEVLPSELRIARGTLHWGRDVVSRGTAGHVGASLPRFDTRKYPGNEVWKIMSGSAILRGSLDAVSFLAPDGDGPRIVPGTAGSVGLEVALADGRGSTRLDADGTVRVKVGAKTLRAHVRTRLVAGGVDFPAGAVDLSGTRVRLTGATFEGSTGKPWEGDAEAPEARLALADGALRARLAARLGDARPLVALLPAGPPRWLGGLLDLRDFTATAHLRTAPGRLALSPARAEAGTFSVDADWRKARDRTWGALLIRKGDLSLGLGLGPSAPSVKLTGATQWFEEEGRPGGLRTDQPRGRGVALRESR